MKVYGRLLFVCLAFSPEILIADADAFAWKIRSMIIFNGVASRHPTPDQEICLCR